MGRSLFSACLLIFCGGIHGQELSFEGNASIQKNGQANFEQIKAGEKIKIKRGDSVLAIPRLGLPILIFSPLNSETQITITNANLNSVALEVLQTDLEKSSNEIVDALRRADQFIQLRNYAQAAQVLSPMKEKYPRVSSLLFLDGTVHFLLNDKATAERDLERGLQIDPENENAKKLLAKIRGGV